MLRAIIHASEILTGSGVRRKDGRRVQDQDLDRIPDGAIVYSVRRVGGREIPVQIEWVGSTEALPKKYLKVRQKNLHGKQAVTPGFVDCHTHLVFAGDRSEEFALRCAGVSYEEIAARGGGILSTVKATRKATAEELERLAIPRVKEAASYGVRTLEIKSGYGLDFDSELKTLEVIARLRKRFPEMKITSTFLGAHAFPKEMSRKDYLAEILDQMLPEVAHSGLADACDVFVDQGYYTLEEGRRIMSRARELGLKVKIHADELANTESASLAVEQKALSADHLLKISEKGIRQLAKAQTVAVLLPGTAFYLKAEYAPARRLLDEGACVALATDFNPGSCMTLSLPTIMTLGALYLGMSRAEIFAAVTYNAAKALGLSSTRGTLEAGLDAAFTVLPFSKFEEVYYRFAWSPAAR